MKTHDRKKLWGRSGNICSFPGCGVELAQEKQASRLIGEEAHIKGERPGAARYDPDQSDEEREAYENRILLCPNHHTEVDADPETWTVEQLLEMKRVHEKQNVENRRHSELVGKLKDLAEEYEYPDDFLDPVRSEKAEPSEIVVIVRVDPSKEGGVKTEIRVRPGQTIVIFARGLISFDGRNNFTTPEGIICNEYGLPYFTKDNEGRLIPTIWPLDRAYKTDGGKLGIVGSLFGWIGEYSEEKAFFIGTKKEIKIMEEGDLYLAVNDAKGTYGDNDGEFRVDIQILEE